ncbi:MAG: hypothetical protein NTY03_04760 [Candidatus Bathyarchaeota archaeon]|nr:hypothetical protein [Candidatus Bathyarchaeota archaeon]
MVDKIHAFGVIIGVAYLLVGVAMINDTAAFIDRGVKTTAEIVNYHRVADFFYPVVMFKDRTGTVIST